MTYIEFFEQEFSSAEELKEAYHSFCVECWDMGAVLHDACLVMYHQKLEALQAAEMVK